MVQLNVSPSFASTFLLCCLAILPLQSTALTAQKDVDALAALQRTWQTSSLAWYGDPCQGPWLGVKCDPSDTKVVELTLPNQNLKGNLPAVIGNLTDLETLDLSFNRNLSGPIPPEIGNLGKLQSLALQYCNFSGKIPSEIGNLSALTFLSLKQNSLTGPIPPSIGKLTNLQWFDTANNFLHGSLPVSTTGGGLDTLVNAQHFHLQHNKFSGSIPSEIFNPSMSLIHLLLHSNSFEGLIPSNVGNLSELNIMRLDYNNLSGPIPASVNELSKLTAIQLSRNLLNGTFPNISDLTHLQILAMESGNLTGQVPSALFSLSNMTQVMLGYNQLNGTLDLRNASLKLVEVDLEQNYISATHTGNYNQILKLQGNPVCNNPKDLPVDACSLSSAPLPSPLPTPTLAPTPALLLPSSDCSCDREFEPNPTASGCMCALPITGVIEFAAQNVPTVVDIIPVLQSGFAIGLNLSSPDQIELTINNPTQLKIWIFPFKNVSWDQITTISIYHTLSSQIIKFLMYGTYSFYPDEVYYVLGRSNTGLNSASKIGIGIGVSLLVIAILAVGFYASTQKKRADKAEQINKPFASWISNGGDSVDAPKLKGAHYFSFTDLRQATNDFSKSNEIGVGGYGKVYIGVLLSGERVAIKRAKAGSMQGVAEFKNEIELLSRVHHKNLVGLVGFCFEQGEQMLVYEYMPNGTLGDCLSGRNGVFLDWQRRVKIALGSAKGLTYLHAEANPPIIHRDIKSSNILLDEKLVAKVADFGLSVLVPDGEEDPVSTEVKGTLGYLDPEYYTTHQLTEKSDVYSFGVVLLELITAKQPIAHGKYIVREVTTALDEGGMDFLRPFLDLNLTDYVESDLQRFLSLALGCVKDEGFHRPTMNQVVKELEALTAHAPVTAKGYGPTAFNIKEGSDDSSQTSVDTSFKYSGSYVFSNMKVEPK